MSVHSPPATDPVGGPGYERRDVNLRAIIWLALAVTATVALTFVGLRGLINSFESVAKDADPQLSPLAPDQTPPLPRLQSTPNLDYVEYRAQQEAQLDTYDWIDKEQGVVRLPISRAIDKALEKGLPQPKPAKQEPTDDTKKSEDSP